MVRQIRKVGKLTKVIVESPLGGFLSLSADETNMFLQPASDRQVETTRLFSPLELLRLSEWVAARSKSFTEKFSCVPEDELGEHRKTNGTKASTTKGFTRKRRTDKTPRQTNRTVSGQNPFHNQSNGYPDKE